MKALFSVMNRLGIRDIAIQWFETLRGSNPSNGKDTLEEFKEKTLEEASHDAIIGIYMFRAQAQELQETNKHSAYTKVADSLSNTLKEFNNIKIIDESENTLMHISLLSSSVNSSLSRLAELLDTFTNERIDQKKESTTSALAEAERIHNTLYEQYDVKKSNDQLSKVVGEKLEDLNKTITTLHKSVQAL